MYRHDISVMCAKFTIGRSIFCSTVDDADVSLLGDVTNFKFYLKDLITNISLILCQGEPLLFVEIFD